MYRVIPKKYENPDSRDLLLKRWKSEWKKWKKTKDSNLKNYSNIESIDSKDKDTVILKRVIDGVPNSSNPDEKMPHYYFLFHEYDPLSNFVSQLPILKESDPIPPNISLKKHKMNKSLYHQYFYIKSILKNLELNDFITKEQSNRITIHYNFLSLFTHINRECMKILSIKYSNSTDNKKSEYSYDSFLSLLISLYVIKFQELCLNTLIIKYHELSQNNLTEISNQIKRNCSIADILWFIYDEPTEFDKNERKMRQQWHRAKISENTYYKNPYDRLKKFIQSTSSPPRSSN